MFLKTTLSATYERLDLKPALKAKWLFLVLFIVFIPQLLYSWNVLQNSMMTDFYSRIIGTRLLVENRSPYFIEQLDPANHSRNSVNGVTATPVALWLLIPLAKMNYCNAKLTWWLIEETILFATAFFTCLYPAKLLKQIITIIITVIFFCYSRNWWVHVFSGQYYVLFAFAFSVVSYYSNKNKHLPLILFPVAALIRPFFVLATLPWLLKDWKQAGKWLLPAIAFAASFLIISGNNKLLPEYNKAMNVYSYEVTGWSKEKIKTSLNQQLINEDCVKQSRLFESFDAACLFSLQHYLRLFGIIINSPAYFTVLLAAVLTILLLLSYKTIMSNNENLVIFSFLVYMLCELFTPANRNPYNMVQYLGILGLLIHVCHTKPMLLFITGLALNHSLPFSFTYQREIGEAVMLFAIYLQLLQKDQRKVEFSDSC